MNKSLNKLDKTRAFLEGMLSWVERHPLPTIPYVGTSSSWFENSPAPYVEIVYSLEGHDRFRIGELEAELPAHHVTIHSVHQGNYSYIKKPRKAWCVFLDVEQDAHLGRQCMEPLYHNVAIYQRDSLLKAFETLSLRSRHCRWSNTFYPPAAGFRDSRDVDSLNTAQRVGIKNALSELLVILYQQTEQSPRRSVVPESIQNALDYIELHYNDAEVSAGHIAGSGHLSTGHFTRVFQAYLKQTPMQYLRHYRIRQATERLAHTDEQVEKIGRECGFADAFHFSRVFRQINGMAPSQYRKQYGLGRESRGPFSIP